MTIFKELYSKDKYFLLPFQYIYKYMRKILDIFEQDEDDDVELTDYQKILALNKKKLNPYEVEFYNSEGEDFHNIIEVRQDGLHFTFDGLDEFLRFFFPEEFGDEGTDGYYEADYLDSMYRGTWEWDFWDRASDDWSEGYIVEALKGESAKVLYEILKKFEPKLLKNFDVWEDGSVELKRTADFSEISDVLEVMDSNIADDLQSAFVNGSYAAVSSEAPQYIEDHYCNGLKEIGIENYSTKHCFWKYELSWGPAIMLFVRHGSPDDNLLDLMIEAIRKEFKNHTPEYYEIQYNAWNNDEFKRVFDRESLSSLERLLDSLNEMESESKGKFSKYLKIVSIISDKIGFRKWKKIATPNHEIYIQDVDKETLKVNYRIKNAKDWYVKNGVTTIESIFDIMNSPQLFDPLSYRN